MSNASGGARPPAMMDVAAVAGVSHQTVSRVINGTGKVAPHTRERVMEAIAQLGYRPNLLARALVTRKSGMLGVITTTSLHYGPTSILLAVELAARQAGYYMSSAPVDDVGAEAISGAIDHFLGLPVEGIVFIAPIRDVAEDLAAIDIPVPVVAVTSSEVGQATGVIAVSVDQELGARQAMSHLLDLGHTDIVHIPGPPASFEAQIREHVWRQMLTERGFIVREPVERGWESPNGYQAGKRLLDEGLPTAVFAGNDELALGLIKALSEQGVRVPEDISVVGFDDLPTSMFYQPSLTTVRQDFASLGRTVLELMIDAINGTSLFGPVNLPAELVVRDSTAPPRA